MSYITLQEAKAFIGITWTADDTLIENMITKSELLINSVLWVETLNEETIDEEHTYNWSCVYYLRGINPTVVNTVDWGAILWTTKLRWRKLQFQYAPILTDDIFNVVEFNYTTWFATIPDDVKFTTMSLTKLFYTDAKNWTISSAWTTLSWISSFSQWELDVKYSTTQKKDKDWQIITVEQEWTSMIKNSLQKYLKNNIYSA